ncbi:MAG: 50S ribosomal protein L6 [Firmicutes bacterium]|nr:50S ribosomal protein L6 [Bacillota bacterium]
MSRVGKTVITIPNGVNVEFANGIVTVSGSNGTLKQEIKTPITVVVEAGTVRVERGAENNQARALHGLYNRLINNMVIGVSQGFTKTLILNGVGYKAAMKGEDLALNLGYSHPSEIKAVAGVKFKVCTPQEIAALNLGKEGIGQVVQVSGASKELVGSVASKIRDLRVVEPYHLYGIRYSDERVLRKESKSGAKGKKK